MITGKKILVTGAAGQIGFPVTKLLAEHNEVWGVARFSNSDLMQELQAVGVETRRVDLADPDFSELPGDFDHVVHLAAFIDQRADFDLAINIDAVGTGRLLSHFRDVDSVLVMSTTSVYRPNPDPWHVYTETDPLGDPVVPGVPTYGVGKVSQEAVARFCAVEFGVRVLIGRMNSAYGPHGGAIAQHADAIVAGKSVTVKSSPSPYSPISHWDIAEHLGPLLDAASAPARIVNFGGDDVVTVQEWCAHIGELTGREPELGLVPVPGSQLGLGLDPTQRIAITGPNKVSWRDGVEATVRARHPQLFS